VQGEGDGDIERLNKLTMPHDVILIDCTLMLMDSHDVKLVVNHDVLLIIVVSDELHPMVDVVLPWSKNAWNQNDDLDYDCHPECIPETHLVEMPSKRQRKRPALINEISTVNQTIKIQKREAAFMASGQKYSIGTSVSKVFYDEDKEKGVNREFSGVIKAYDAEEGLYLITYADGDEEELNERELGKIAVGLKKVSKSLQHGKQEMPSKTATKWSIFNDLKMTQEEIEESLPNMREMIHECCWVEWEGSHKPALILSPFDLSGDVDIVKEWIKNSKQSFAPPRDRSRVCMSN